MIVSLHRNNVSLGKTNGFLMNNCFRNNTIFFMNISEVLIYENAFPLILMFIQLVYFHYSWL